MLVSIAPTACLVGPGRVQRFLLAGASDDHVGVGVLELG